MTATVTSNSTAAQPTIRPIANGTYRDCVNYLNPPVFLDVSRHNSSTRCSDIARIYGVTIANLIEWNPTLEGSDEASCQVSANYRYCVQRFRLEEEHATEYCLRKELATAAYTCKQFASTRGIDFGQFVAWNPSVGVDCEDYEPGMFPLPCLGTLRTTSCLPMLPDASRGSNLAGMISYRNRILRGRLGISSARHHINLQQICHA